MEVVSTGLPYLIVPLASGLEKAKIRVKNFEILLAEVNAKFVYVFDVAKMEGRTWDNFGIVEDVATGSAAGPMGAYLLKRDMCKEDEKIEINQGGFVGRPSIIEVYTNQYTGEISVAGDVKIVAKGELFI
jgi:PhzF family phenazine biosynthesis protein